MHATVYGRGQMVIPAQARKESRIDQGDVVSVQPDGDGRIVLVRLERAARRAPAKVRFISRKGRHAVATVGRPISREQVHAALADFP